MNEVNDRGSATPSRRATETESRSRVAQATGEARQEPLSDLTPIPIVGSHMQSLIPRGKGPILFTFAYALAFSAGFIYGGNKEFALYTLMVIAVAVVVAYILRYVHIPNLMLWGLALIGVLHMLGGGMHVNGERLYGYQLFNIYSGDVPGLIILKYDQLVHMIGYGVFAAVALFLLHRIAPHMHAGARAAIAVLIAMAAGSLNELGEFIAVLLLPSTGVGDYFNSMLDLSFNTLGAVIAVGAYELLPRLKKRLQ